MQDKGNYLLSIVSKLFSKYFVGSFDECVKEASNYENTLSKIEIKLCEVMDGDEI